MVHDGLMMVNGWMLHDMMQTYLYPESVFMWATCVFNHPMIDWLVPDFLAVLVVVWCFQAMKSNRRWAMGVIILGL